jgi:hypothetical protein
MQINRFLRTSLLTLAGYAGFSATARAQLVPVVAEAPVTFQVTITTAAQSTAGGVRTNTTTQTRLTQAQILEELRTVGVIPGASIAGWSLVGVQLPFGQGAASDDPATVDASLAFLAPFAELSEVSSYLSFYVANGSQRVAVPRSILASIPTPNSQINGQSVAKYKERHIGGYVLISSGSITHHSNILWQLPFSVGSQRFIPNSSSTDGFASISYATKDSADGYEVFFYATSAVRSNVRGGLSGTLGGIASSAIVNVAMTQGAVKLMPLSIY